MNNNKNQSIVNAFTIDVEDYFQVSALAPHIARSDWDKIDCRVERNVERLLATLAEHEDHHPEMTVGYTTCRVSWTTHSAGSALSDNDFICAAKANALYLNQENA